MTGLRATKPPLRVLDGEPVWPLPIWLMRQAGRYLPEYREVRAGAGSFLDLCYNPSLAAEVTLQDPPLRLRRGDHPDILVVPHALGQDVRFVENEGPRLEPDHLAGGSRPLGRRAASGRLAPVLEALERVKGALPRETALLGFCGAPWTVASYMIAGKGTPDQAPARRRLSRPSHDGPDRPARRGLDGLSDGPDRCRRRCRADLRELRRALPPALFRPLSLEPIGRTCAASRRRGRRRGSSCSCAAAVQSAPARRGRFCRLRRPRLDLRSRGGVQSAEDPRHARQPRPSPSSPAARRWSAASTRSFRPCADARTSSISATASCRKPRSRMSSACWSGWSVRCQGLLPPHSIRRSSMISRLSLWGISFWLCRPT